MRQLTDTDDPKRARKIVDALLVRGIDAEVRPEAGSQIWVHEDAQLPDARRYLEELGRDEPPDATKEAAVLRRLRKAADEDAAHRFHDMRQRWLGGATAKVGPISLLLIVASVVVALLGELDPFLDERMWNLTIDAWDSEVPLQRVQQGEYWRIFTPIFLHFGLVHLGLNMLWVWHLGGQVERGKGTGVMIALVLVSAAAGNLGQYFVSGPAFGGMSGVVYALFGFCWMTSRYDPRSPYVMYGSTVVYAMVWFVLGATGAFGPIANIGHAGGLVVGLVFGLPAFARHLWARSTRPDYDTDHGWTATHVRGWRRFRRRWIDPYVPVWFLALAGLVIAMDLHDARDRDPQCRARVMRIFDYCATHLDETQAGAFFESIDEETWEHLGDPEAPADHCADALAALEAAATQFHCAPSR